jgi:hypothetical protein
MAAYWLIDMLWYLLFEAIMFVILFVVFRKIALEVVTDWRYWVTVAVWAFFILVVAETFAYNWNLWVFPGEYLFGTTPFGYPIVEEFLFVIQSSLAIVCTWKWMNERR